MLHSRRRCRPLLLSAANENTIMPSARGWVVWKLLLATVAVALLQAGAHAQEIRFTSAQQVLAEFADLGSRISSFDREVITYQRQLEVQAGLVEQRETSLKAVLAQVPGLVERIDEQRNSGQSTAAAEAELALLRVGAAAEALLLDDEVQARDAKIERLRTAQSTKDRLEARRSYLLGTYRAELEPVYLRGVTIRFDDPRDEIDEIYYSGEWAGAGEDAIAEAAIVEMAASLEDVSREVEEFERRRAAAERRFIAADRRWHARNQDYIANVTKVAAITDIVMEASDVGIALALSGPGWPAVLAFEAIYRPAEAIYKGDPHSSLPTLSEEMLEARAHASEMGMGPGGFGVLGIPVDPTGHFGTTLYDESASEVIKNVVGTGYAGLAETIAQGAVIYYRDAARARVRTRWQVFALSRISPRISPQQLYKTLGGTVIEEEAQFAALMRRAAGTASVDGLLATMGKGKFWTDAGKGLGVGLLVTAVKAGATEVVGSRAQSIFEDLAHLEIDWFVHQRAYQTANHVLRFHQQVQRGLTDALASAVAERDAAASARQLSIATAERVVLSDWQVGQGVMLELAFSDRLLHSQYGFADGRLYLSGPGLANHRTDLAPAAVRATDDKPAVLKVEVETNAPYGLHDGFDADPATAARLLPSGRWEGRNEGPDRAHSMTFAAPFLRLVDPPDEIRVGDTFTVAYRAPSNTREGAWIGVVKAAETPEAFPADVADSTTYAAALSNVVAVSPDPSGSEGSAALTPLQPGRYEVRLYDRNQQGIVVARVPVCFTYVNPVETARYDPCGNSPDIDELSEACLAGGAPAVVVSSFDPGSSGADGWTLAGDAGPQPEVIGNSIQGKDREGGSVWYYVAPEKFLGNQAGYFGKRLTYRIRVTPITKPFSAADVVIDGKDFSIALETGILPGESWSNIGHVLNSSAGWTVVGGGDSPATDAEICRTLSSITALRIRGEYQTGPDTGWLGEVALGD